jgi:hypothetical protein
MRYDNPIFDVEKDIFKQGSKTGHRQTDSGKAIKL